MDNHIAGGESLICGAFDARTHLAKLLDRVQRGEIITITRRGIAVAKLTPIPSPTAQDKSELLGRFAAFRKNHPLHDLPTSELVDEGRRV
ncbi:MAG: type II toxin-antitoxin system prevent-host-death family antitoxin [Planctomycetes bacterium]|nr:type II toxin-antitoxin system prevent-host-death family antitoxin [Planctomycetota bacterium]MCB9918604.1 type II toxin-antitoxin system prevent-host-death family antitoxin [Planctomycetota bacterium]